MRFSESVTGGLPGFAAGFEDHVAAEQDHYDGDGYAHNGE